MNVSAIIVTRGDVDLAPVLDSLPLEWQKIVWDNANGKTVYFPGVAGRNLGGVRVPCEDLAVYGRYAAIDSARHELIYVQDDDCVVSDPMALARAWYETSQYRYDGRGLGSPPDPRDFVDHVVCNMPERFRHEFYVDHALVGFGAIFHRDAPATAFTRFWSYFEPKAWAWPEYEARKDLFNRTADIVFTSLTPRVLVDVPYEDLPWASTDERMWKQPSHQAERSRMLSMVKRVRDAG